jgi:hypothetical protein
MSVDKAGKASELMVRMGRGIGSLARTIGGVALGVGIAAALASPASAAIDLSRFDASITGADGSVVRQAGAHADINVGFRVPIRDENDSLSGPIEQPHRFRVDLPPGIVGDPRAIERCPTSGLKAGFNGLGAICPVPSQVGIARVYAAGSTTRLPVYNVVPPPDRPAAFAFNYLGVVVRMAPRVRPDDYGITIETYDISQALHIDGSDVQLWGVPADPSHDAERYAGSPFPQPGSPTHAPRRAFLSLGTDCSPMNRGMTAFIDGWRSIGSFTTETIVQDTSGESFDNVGCESLEFEPAIDVAPTSRATDAPTGLEVDLRMPQTDAPDGLATAHLKDVKMVLPEGLSVSPSSATGLGACSPAQIGLGTDSAPTCPVSSKIGTVSVETPVLDRPLAGDVILATPDDNPFGSLIALYIVAEGSGVLIKLPGEVQAHPVTGQLTATFKNNPQLPFSSLKVRFDGGENASLAMPTACGRFDTRTDLDSWSGKAVSPISPLAVDQGCGPRGFAPSFRAGAESPVAGGFSPFSLAIGRDDRTEELRTLESLKLPKGLLARVASVPLCSDSDADAGTCGAGSRVGHVQVAAGPGGSPLWVPQQGKEPTTASLAGPYRGAPYSLSVVVPAQAGPFDLGRVVVRSALHIDRVTAQLSTGIDQSRVYDRRGALTKTIEGAMPTIVEGIPLRVRDLRVIMDRPGFMVNPTSCAPASIDAALRSVTGQVAQVGSRFQVGDCQSLGFTPKLGMRLTGKGRTRTGSHPGLSATLRQAKGQANIAKAEVKLPSSVVLDPSNSTDPALVCDYDKGLAADCPASSIIGKATARTPLLGKPLTGDVHLVQGIRFGPTGNRIRTTPSLLVKLRGEVALDLRGKTTVRDNRLVTTFGQVPDAPVSRFDVKINGGSKGILVITRTRKAKINLCAKPSSHSAAIALDGQNGKRAGFATKVKTPCNAKAGKRSKRAKNKK